MATGFISDKSVWNLDLKSFPKNGSIEQKLRFLIRYAILAPSSHNTQPWKFRIDGNTIEILIDFSGWLEIADSDRRELYISIGCALENLLVAGENTGFITDVSLFPEPERDDLVAAVRFERQNDVALNNSDVLFENIVRRRTNRQKYKLASIPAGKIDQLRNQCMYESVHLDFIRDKQIIHELNDLLIKSDIELFSDSDYRRELGYWIGRGVFGTSWLVSKLGQLMVTFLDMGKKQAVKDSDLLLSSSHVAVISTDTDQPVSQVKSGQVFERTALLASAVDISVHPMSQILEVDGLKDQLAGLKPISGYYPQHLFRLGYSESAKGHSPRKKIEDVIISADF